MYLNISHPKRKEKVSSIVHTALPALISCKGPLLQYRNHPLQSSFLSPTSLSFVHQTCWGAPALRLALPSPRSSAQGSHTSTFVTQHMKQVVMPFIVDNFLLWSGCTTIICWGDCATPAFILGFWPTCGHCQPTWSFYQSSTTMQTRWVYDWCVVLSQAWYAC